MVDELLQGTMLQTQGFEGNRGAARAAGTQVGREPLAVDTRHGRLRDRDFLDRRDDHVGSRLRRRRGGDHGTALAAQGAEPADDQERDHVNRGHRRPATRLPAAAPDPPGDQRRHEALGRQGSEHPGVVAARRQNRGEQGEEDCGGGGAAPQGFSEGRNVAHVGLLVSPAPATCRRVPGDATFRPGRAHGLEGGVGTARVRACPRTWPPARRDR
jgi:hypothetical protein